MKTAIETRQVICPACNGNGCRYPEREPRFRERCKRCNGAGGWEVVVEPNDEEEGGE